MPGARGQKRGEELLRRDVEVVSIHTYMSLHIVEPKGLEPSIGSDPWLEVRGNVTEPIRDVTELVISVHGKDRPTPGPVRPLSVGAIIQIRPHVSAVVTFPRREFDHLWWMALSGHLKHAHIIFTKPHYNSALVTHLSLSNEPIE